MTSFPKGNHRIHQPNAHEDQEPEKIPEEKKANHVNGLRIKDPEESHSDPRVANQPPTNKQRTT